MNFELKTYHPTDLKEVVSLFTETVHHVNSKDYSPRQIAVWAPKKPDLVRWQSRFSGSECRLAVGPKGKLLGFGNLVDYNFLDFLYVHKDHQSQGVASAILEEIEEIARRWGSSVISLNASKTARPFFEKHGFEVIRQQEVQREGVGLVNYHMRKRI